MTLLREPERLIEKMDQKKQWLLALMGMASYIFWFHAACFNFDLYPLEQMVSKVTAVVDLISFFKIPGGRL